MGVGGFYETINFPSYSEMGRKLEILWKQKRQGHIRLLCILFIQRCCFLTVKQFLVYSLLVLMNRFSLSPSFGSVDDNFAGYV